MKSSTPDRSRTCDLRFRKPSLYPTELREQRADFSAFFTLLGVPANRHSIEHTTVYTTFSDHM